MKLSEKGRFADMFGGLCVNYGRQASKEAMRLYWNMLENYALADVERAFQAHMRSSRFFPTVADVIEAVGIVRPALRRPGPEEAWARCPKSEQQSALMTREMIAAWQVSSSVMEEGTYTARRAFIETYDRLCKAAEARQEPVGWALSQGFDKAHLAEVVDDALVNGYLTREDVGPVLAQLESYQQPVRGALVPQLEGAKDEAAEAEARARLCEFLARTKAALMPPVEPVNWDQVHQELDDLGQRMEAAGHPRQSAA